MDIREHKGEIQFLLAEDNVSQAIKRSMDFVRDFGNHRDLLNEVIVISGNYNRIKNNSRRGLLAVDEADPKFNKLLYQLLDLLDQVEDAFIHQAVPAD